MIDFATNRRDLLKLASLGLSATAVPAAHALSQSAAHGSAASLFDVRAYGGVGDGKAVDSPAFNRAIEAASAAGGGTVLVPAGVYLCFTIRLKSYVHLY